MITVVIVGAKGAGKTTLVKSLIAKSNQKSLLIYDINKEYKEFYTEPFLLMPEFLEVAKRTRNGVIVFEESTIFFNNRGSADTVSDILVRARHTNNLIVFIFHSLRAIPRHIRDLTNYYYVFKTNDDPKFITQKFEPNFMIVFESVKNNPDRHYHEIFIANTLPESR